jgi:hypothetical protein
VFFIENILNKKINAEIDKDAFDWIFPRSLFHHVEAAIKKSITTDCYEVKEYKLT